MKVVIAGGGVIGLSCAVMLALEGEKVQVITRNPEEASSWAAGGMLAPFSEGLEGELFEFSYRSLKAYPEFVRLLMDVSGKRVDFREGGIYRVVLKGEENLLNKSKEYAKAGYGVEQIERLEGMGLSEEVLSLIHYREEAWVDTETLRDALFSAIKRLGIELTLDSVKAVHKEDRTVKELKGLTSDYRGDFYLFALGAWIRELFELPVYPVKGQALKVKGMDLERVHYSSVSYLIPREGYLYIGATSEAVGFTPGNTLEGLKSLSEGAMRVIPSLGRTCFMDSLYGYRPATPDEKPVFESGDNYLVMAGHHRNGILHAPLSAKLAKSYIKGISEPFLKSFSAERFLSAG